ncbi:uncharacterized protein [Clytia hemisphaerica]|uniref:uncharacterized protein n=1 Tax=Clytia hemisphaerica TaxID=252671 RepID=UPI0034D3CB70
MCSRNEESRQQTEREEVRTYKMPERKLIIEITKKFPDIGEYFLENDNNDNDVCGMKYSDFKKFLVGFPPLDRTGAWNIVQDWMYTCDTPPISPRRREQAQDSLSLLQIYTPKTKKMIDEIPIQIRSTPSVSTQSRSTPSVSTQSRSTPSVSTQS